MTISRITLLVIATVLLATTTSAFPTAKKLGSKLLLVRGGGPVAQTAANVAIPEMRPPKSMYSNAVEIGAAKASLPALKTFLLGILSGCHVSFGAFLLLSVGGACPGLLQSNPGLQKIVSGAFGLPFGLMMTLTAGGELFTGNTCFVTTAVVEKRATLKSLIKNWFLSYTGNFIGTILMAFLAFYSGTMGTSTAAVTTAVAKTSMPFVTAFIRAVLCNWLVSMSVYIASGASSLSSKMIAIWFPISALVALGLEHSIANMFFIPFGMLRGAPVTTSDFLLKNILPVTLGNIVGGAGCVALMYSAIYGSLLEKKPVEAK